MTVVLYEGASISGRVIDETGNPKPGARVAIRLSKGFVTESGSRGHADGTTELDGGFLLERVPAGTYRLWASAHGSGKATVEPIEVVDGRNLGGLELVLREGDEATVSGRVVDRQGRGIQAQVMWVAGQGPGGVGGASGLVGEVSPSAGQARGHLGFCTTRGRCLDRGADSG